MKRPQQGPKRRRVFRHLDGTTSNVVSISKRAAEESKRQQEAKDAERRLVIAERTGPKDNLDDSDEEQKVSLKNKRT